MYANSSTGSNSSLNTPVTRHDPYASGNSSFEVPPVDYHQQQQQTSATTASAALHQQQQLYASTGAYNSAANQQAQAPPSAGFGVFDTTASSTSSTGAANTSGALFGTPYANAAQAAAATSAMMLDPAYPATTAHLLAAGAAATQQGATPGFPSMFPSMSATPAMLANPYMQMQLQQQQQLLGLGATGTSDATAAAAAYMMAQQQQPAMLSTQQQQQQQYVMMMQQQQQQQQQYSNSGYGGGYSGGNSPQGRKPHHQQYQQQQQQQQQQYRHNQPQPQQHQHRQYNNSNSNNSNSNKGEHVTKGDNNSAPQPPHNVTYEELSAQLGNLAELSRTANGSSFLQTALRENADARNLPAIWKEVEPVFTDLLLDAHGCYVVKSVMERLQADDLKHVVDVISADEELTYSLCTHSLHTRRVVQFLMESSNNNSAAAAAVDGGEHQRSFPFILDIVVRRCEEISKTQQGCIVMQKAMDVARGDQHDKLFAKIYENLVDFALDPFANYVVQHLLEVGNRDENSAAIAEQFVGHIVELSCNKFASNCVEKCLFHVTPDAQHTLLMELYSVPEQMLYKLIQDSFGNYIIQSSIALATFKDVFEINERLRPVLQNTPYGYKIEARLDRRLKGKPVGTRSPLIGSHVPKGGMNNNGGNNNNMYGGRGGRGGGGGGGRGGNRGGYQQYQPHHYQQQQYDILEEELQQQQQQDPTTSAAQMMMGMANPYASSTSSGSQRQQQQHQQHLALAVPPPFTHPTAVTTSNEREMEEPW